MVNNRCIIRDARSFLAEGRELLAKRRVSEAYKEKEQALQSELTRYKDFYARKYGEDFCRTCDNSIAEHWKSELEELSEGWALVWSEYKYKVCDCSEIDWREELIALAESAKFDWHGFDWYGRDTK